jgi:glycosyltransferase involved in cell wall biosynthesis
MGPLTLRVAIVAPSLRHMLGGQEVQGDQLVRGWIGSNVVEAQLIETNPVCRGPFSFVERIPIVRTIFRVPARVVALASALRNADIMHVFAGAHSSFLLGSLPAIVAAKAAGKRVIVHYHSPFAEAHLGRSSLARFVLRHCDAVVVPSQYLHDIFLRHHVATRIIPNVVDAERFRWRKAAVMNDVVVCIRNFEHRYGVDDVIRAFTNVQQVLPDAALVLVGAGPEERALVGLVEALGVRNVTFAGAVARDALPRVLESCAIMINASREDNMPLTIMEAFAGGIPVVTTTAGGIPTFALHERNALLAAPNDVEVLARHVTTLLNDRAHAMRLASAARVDVQQFTWDVVGPAWQALYTELRDPRASAPA